MVQFRVTQRRKSLPHPYADLFNLRSRLHNERLFLSISTKEHRRYPQHDLAERRLTRESRDTEEQAARAFHY